MQQESNEVDPEVELSQLLATSLDLDNNEIYHSEINNNEINNVIEVVENVATNLNKDSEKINDLENLNEEPQIIESFPEKVATNLNEESESDAQVQSINKSQSNGGSAIIRPLPVRILPLNIRNEIKKQAKEQIKKSDAFF